MLVSSGEARCVIGELARERIADFVNPKRRHHEYDVYRRLPRRAAVDALVSRPSSTLGMTHFNRTGCIGNDKLHRERSCSSRTQATICAVDTGVSNELNSSMRRTASRRVNVSETIGGARCLRCCRLAALWRAYPTLCLPG